MMKNFSIISYVRGPAFAFICTLAVILFVQAPVLAFVLSSLSQFALPWNWVWATPSAIAMDAMIFFFAVRGRSWQTATTMLLTVLISLQYYWSEILEADMAFVKLSIGALGAISPILVFLVSRELNLPDQLDVGSRSQNKEIADMLLAGRTYDQIIAHFKDKGVPISKDKIAKIKKSIARIQEGKKV